jgi:hypothetical protein
MLHFLKVLRRVFVLGRIATTHVPACQAQPKMYPSVTHFHALFAHVLAGLLYFDLIEMGALISHISFPKRRLFRVK